MKNARKMSKSLFWGTTAFVTAIGLAGVALAGDVPGHDTCEVGGADDIYNLSAFFDDNETSDSTDDLQIKDHYENGGQEIQTVVLGRDL